MNNFKKLLNINKKKALSLAVATAMATSALSGCSKKAPTKPLSPEEEEENNNNNNNNHRGGGFFFFGGRNYGGKSGVTNDKSNT